MTICTFKSIFDLLGYVVCDFSLNWVTDSCVLFNYYYYISYYVLLLSYILLWNCTRHLGIRQGKFQYPIILESF